MPETLQKTEETLGTEVGLEEVTPADERQAKTLADAWQLSRAPSDLWPALEKALEAQDASGKSDRTEEILSELKALRGEISSLRREVAELRRAQKPGNTASSTTLMPYVRADDRALPLG